ncbi:hypothetical protein [Bacillus toyonensis]|uniref:hypothetical protein n=1 Tax=Bacillus toyonensis TaxID=155322 RepID=UPI000BF17291|nr:hypothetical protein [Bacillus toyonensis]PEK79373.1 hypothetical protein CN594_25505 [Bacillus toyonensis]PEO69740.1 hypothetical protein CN579_03520 [Bacillus toyonensis]PFY41168.1 hypothetical protein COL55_23780 [Bacillus toyonensis]PFY44454.1 hypothetical protein COL54_11625 [Bacillus toyonensis]PFY81334.1 hypothetical protein COL62_10990 [Bacillus toyonensis]
MNKEREDISYRTLCEFEKSFLENFKEKDDGNIEFSSFNLEDKERMFPTQLITYTSFKDLFEEQYKESFLISIESLDLKEIDSKVGAGTLDTIMAKDSIIRIRYEEITRERDLDNDGTPDRIDIDDTKNSVQTVGDLDKVKSSTNKETEEDNDDKKEKKIKRKSHDMEL